MDALGDRLQKTGFLITCNPRGDGNCFFQAEAFQLGTDTEKVKAVVFDYLENNQYDVFITSSICLLSMFKRLLKILKLFRGRC